MATEVEKIKEITYNSTVTLALIEMDEDLKAIFTDEIKLSFSVLYKLSEENRLSERTKDLLVNIFEMVILTKRDLIDKYLRLANNRGVSINTIKEIEIEIEEQPEYDEEESVVKQVVEEKPKKVKKEKTGKELPRRYGRAKILQDIERQGGVITLHQRTGLNLNELKNIYVNLNSRLVKMLVADEKIFSDEECRTINSAITTLNNKLKNLVKK